MPEASPRHLITMAFGPHSATVYLMIGARVARLRLRDSHSNTSPNPSSPVQVVTGTGSGGSNSNSNAPTSHAGPCGRATMRWSTNTALPALSFFGFLTNCCNCQKNLAVWLWLCGCLAVGCLPQGCELSVKCQVLLYNWARRSCS